MLRAFALAALAAAPVSADPYEEIRALDAAAGFELEALKNRCTDGQPDVDAAAAAERAAHIHRTRIGLARKIAAATPGGPGPEDLVPLAFQAADALSKQFGCDPGTAAPLEAARTLLAGLRAELSDPNSPGAQALDRRIAGFDEQLAAFHAAHPPPAAAAAATVRIVTLDGVVTPVPQDSTLARLSLRLEVGANFVRAGEPPDYFYHRGPTARFSILARHRVGASGRVHLAFGPYYAFSRVAQFARPDGDAWYAGPITTHRVGGQFEVQWVPAPALQRWLSLNPAVEVGLEQQGYDGRGSGRATGFQAGGGLSLCIWQQSICPGVRALVSPLARGNAVVAVQAGVALDVLRLADIGLRAAAGKRRAR